MKTYYVYILASQKNGTLYIGMTNDLIRRIMEHRQGKSKGFTQKYGVYMLVHCEHTNDVHAAVAREKQLKNWHRQWKVNLINQHNPEWTDLFWEVSGMIPGPCHAEFISASMDPETSSG